MSTDPTLIASLKELHKKIAAYPDPRRASSEWKQAYNLLKKTSIPKSTVDNVVAMRGLDRLTELIDQLDTPEPEVDDSNAPSADECHQAMRAFRKRLRLTQLDNDSEVNSRDPLTGGSSGRVLAIEPPRDYPPAVWRELARQGKLRYTGNGMYELIES